MGSEIVNEVGLNAIASVCKLLSDFGKSSPFSWIRPQCHFEDLVENWIVDSTRGYDLVLLLVEFVHELRNCLRIGPVK